MSGGHFNYMQHGLFEISLEIRQIISDNESEEKERYCVGNLR